MGTIVNGNTVLIMFGVETSWVRLDPKSAKVIGRKLLRQADEAERIPQFGVAKK
jgi:hypothetical protein